MTVQGSSASCLRLCHLKTLCKLANYTPAAAVDRTYDLLGNAQEPCVMLEANAFAIAVSDTHGKGVHMRANGNDKVSLQD